MHDLDSTIVGVILVQFGIFNRHIFNQERSQKVCHAFKEPFSYWILVFPAHYQELSSI